MWLGVSAAMICQYDFYSHIPCGMWQVCPHCRKKQGGISTHTSRVGCDVSEILTASIFKSHFYSHIPCGMWPCVRQARVISAQFLLTHPVWDVTKKSWRTSGSLTFLLTHPVWDVTNRKRKLTNQLKFLLTHPVWDVTQNIIPNNGKLRFLLTHPVWDVTGQQQL